MAETIIMVTGSNGLIGDSLVQCLVKLPNIKVVGISKGECRSHEYPNFQYRKLDITNTEELETIVTKIQPDVIVHCAAISQVDICEEHPKLCSDVNVSATKNLVELANRVQAKFIFLSSDFVFNGFEEWYESNTIPRPISVYGKSKLEGERIVKNGISNYVIIRPVLVYGYSMAAGRTNIFYWVYKSLSEGKNIQVVNDQFRTPTYVGDVVNLILLAIEKNAIGIFNIGGSTRLSVYDFAVQVAKASKLPELLVNSNSSNSISKAYLRPVNSCFTNFEIRRDFDLNPKSSLEGIELALKQLRSQEI